MGKDSRRPGRIAAKQKKLEDEAQAKENARLIAQEEEEARLRNQAEEARLRAQAIEAKRLKIAEAVEAARKEEEARLKALADEEAADAEFQVINNDVPEPLVIIGHPVAAATNAIVINGNNTPGGGSNKVSFTAQPAAEHALTVAGEISAASSSGWFGGWFSK